MSTWSRYLKVIAQGDRLERMVFFSDAVFAIAMTLLVVELHVPEVPQAELGPALAELVPGYLSFLLSFAVVGLVWLSHHRKLGVVVRFDQDLLRLNLLMLLFVASLPLPSAVLGRYGDDELAVYLYAATIAGIGLSMTAIWVYAWHRRLVSPEVDVAMFRLVLVQSLPIPGIFLLSIPVAALFGATAAEITWIAALPLSFVITRVYRARSSAGIQEVAR
jgi:uncharacterized membrane protein